ncbi:MAG: aminotransferase class I/II-fold pyridoxal phosphate-dependent enzyme, partial [Tissierellia bacterium]|nr:aminotransferase class I/II-fold pyridoxal phosphate-dependent enzyme [Tissierellia bacterium]
MLYFMNDYSEGAHPRIIEALTKTNMEQHVGYGLDDYCENAKDLIKKRIGQLDVDVHLLVAGTQTNIIAISSFLRPYEAVISTELGHISVHETGAIEATGHKIIEMPSADGLLKPEDIDKACNSHVDEHMVLPRLVYISDATEMGSIYTKAQLEAIRKKCDERGLYLYLDGARLATALTCDDNDLTIKDIAELTDAFYIGGTKNGMLFGEALVIINTKLKPYMRHAIKQRG